jgi:RES domain-containing protein
LVEVLVHLEVESEDIPSSYQLVAVDLSDDAAFAAIETDQLAPDWRDQINNTRQLGDAWLEQNRVSLLRVPSAIVPFATNWLLNPAHAEAANVRIAQTMRIPFDRRFFE